MPRVVQIPLSDDEFAKLEEKANAEGSSISQYIKDIVLPGNDFRRWFPELLHRVESVSNGTKFNIRSVMGTDWINIPKGVRLALGRGFYKHVAVNKLKNVYATEMDSAKTQWYKAEATECDFKGESGGKK